VHQIIKIQIVLYLMLHVQIIAMEMEIVTIKLEFVLAHQDGLELCVMNKLFKVFNLNLNCWKFIF